MDDRGVRFRTKTGEAVTLRDVDFLCRWLRHILPKGFTKIRHYGLMSASHATTRLGVARVLLAATHKPLVAAPCSAEAEADTNPPVRTATWRDVILRLTGIDVTACPHCGSRALERRPVPRAFPDARAPPKAA